MSAGLEDDSDPTYTHFAHRAEFLQLLERFLAVDVRREPSSHEDEQEEGLVIQLGAILDCYLPLPGLLDPSLSDIVPPLMDVLSSALAQLIDDPKLSFSARRLQRHGRLINWVVKVRGWKAVIPQFPSSIHYLPILVTLLSPPNSPSTSTSLPTPHHPLISSQDAWELRAVLLLWLALLLTVPFNLSALSSEDVPINTVDLPSLRLLFPGPISSLAKQAILLSIPFLHRPGKEGAYAALVLARLYSRSDVVQHLPGFLAWADEELREGEREGEANFVASLFSLLSVLPTLLSPQYLSLLDGFTSTTLLPHLRGTRTAAGSGLIRKLAVKAQGRRWVAELGNASSNVSEMPEGLEEQLDDLMNGLSDKDTIVRYSCAKYLARLSVLLPTAFSEQIVLATIGLFAGTEDEPVVETPFGFVIDPGGTASSDGTMGFGGAETTRGEARWHGCCLAIAELARRGLVKGDEAIGESVEWVLKALTFDLRRASHSIGANVRDAAAYLIWSLSRACRPSAIEPYAERLGTALATVACFDREVGVRRAASAAFQEGVGRLGLYPEGIDVLGKTDFYSVSVRRIAFSTAAPGVAIHGVYRARMRDHLHYITLRHWDVAMRHLGAAALRKILELGNDNDLSDSLDREMKELPSLDAVNAHGALVALIQISEMLSPEDERRREIISALAKIRPAALVSPQGADVVQAACDLITNCLSPMLVQKSIAQESYNHYLDLALLRKEADCHEAAARMIGRMSELRDAAVEVHKLLSGIKSPRASVKQMSALSLGSVRYANCLESLDKTIKALLSLLDASGRADVETRRYAIRSLAGIVGQTRTDGAILVNKTIFQTIFTAFIAALSDYSTDQRGDVGSWIRVSALTALGQSISIAASGTSASNLIPQGMFEEAIAGMVKQGGEKLEPVRATVWRSWRTIRSSGSGSTWQWEGHEIWDFDVKDDSDEAFRYIELKDWHASAMPVLQTKYRSSLVAGVLHSIGSQVESVGTLAFEELRKYLLSVDNAAHLLHSILCDLQSVLQGYVNQNRTFIPAISTITRIVSDTSLKTQLHSRFSAASPLPRILSTACRGIPQIKSIERITGVMRLVIALIGTTDTTSRNKAIEALPLFLSHRFPRIRAMASEALYNALSDSYEEIEPDLETLLLETNWSATDAGPEESKQVVELLRSQI